MKFAWIIIYLLSFYLTPNRLYASWQHVVSGKDHALESDKHVHVARNFIEKTMKDKGLYSAYKISEFIDFLTEQRNRIKDDIYETTVIEKKELEITKLKKAEEKALKKSNLQTSAILRVYDEYFIPIMETLLDKVVKGESGDYLDGLVDDFIRGYIPYYVPNAQRTAWPRDLDLKHNLGKLFSRYKFEKDDKKKIAANNLIISNNELVDVQACLGEYKKLGEYLQQDEIIKLKECAFDISRFDPGVSSLWQGLKQGDLEGIHKVSENVYPQESEIVYFDKVILRGHQSPKIKVEFTRDGIKRSLKLKMGYEVHTDKASSKILELVGLNQDSMKYYPRLKVHLGKTPFEEFRSTFANKYGVESIIRYITSHGSDEKGDWILLHDLLLETRDNDEIRVSPIDFSSWDLGNRREYRSLLLLWGWLGIQNIKPSNFKLLFKKTAHGLKPLHRMHDLGTSLGTPCSLTRPYYILSILENENVNVFPESFIKLDKKRGRIKLLWNDISKFKRIFDYTSWDDLKWMGRKILQIRKEDIYLALINSGMVKEVADLYLVKLLKRRNEIRVSFSLEEEFDADSPTPLKQINMMNKNNEVIVKKGKLIQKHFEDKNSLAIAPERWITFFSKLFTFDLPIYDWTHQRTKNNIGIKTDGMTGLQAAMGVKDADKKPFAMTTLPIGVGVQAVLSRHVSTNNQMMNNNKMFHVYKVIDRIKLRFALDSPFLSKALKKAKYIGGDVGLRFYEYEIQFIHFNDNLKKAYFSRFNLLKILQQPLKYAAYELNPLEIISSYNRIGVEVEGDIRIFSLRPGVQNQVALTAGIRKSSRHYLLRDQFGQLHIYSDKARNSYLGFSLGLAEIDLFFTKLPLLKIQASFHRFKTNVIDYILPLESHDRRYVDKVLTTERRELEYQVLRQLKKRKKEDPLPSLVKTNYKLFAKGKTTTLGFGGAFLFNNEKTKTQSHTEILLPSGKIKKFYRYSHVTSRSKGIDSSSIPLMDILTSKRKRTRIDLEMNREKPENFVVAVRIQDYYRVRNKEKLKKLIADLNRRFSVSPETEFYRNYLLPEKSFVNKYRKIYGITRLLISGNKLVRKLQELPRQRMKEMLTRHFWDTQFLIQKKAVTEMGNRERLKFTLRKSSILRTLKKIKKSIQCEEEDCYKKSSKLYVKLLSKLKIENFGTHFLNELLGEKGLLVMGEIAGVIPSFSTLQDLQSLQRRRFAAKHWGTFNKTLPIQKYLRYKRLLPPLIHLEKNVSDSLVFGELESSLPPNIEALFATSTKF